ncbi:MAG: DMT family transporter [Acidimicrobiia bacterium]|nr:DMT family transporter [Acidimicrobiia bacterium]
MGGLSFAIAAALLWGGGSYVGGRATRTTPASVVVLWGLVAALVVAVPLALLDGSSGIASIPWGVIAGLFGAAGAVALYHGLANATAAVVAPLAGVVGAALPTVAGVLLGERPKPAAWAGVALALPAIWLLAADRLRLGPGASFGAIAGLSFGSEFIILGRVPADSGLWPVVGTLFGGVLTVLAAVIRRRLPLGVPRPALVAAIVAALFNFGAVTSFLFATRRGMVSLSSVVASLYPAPTVALAALLDHERIRPSHLVGGILALSAVGLIAT